MENQAIYWATKTVKLSELKGLPKNPRKISVERRKKLQHWLEKYNLSDIPVINTDGTIISGNQRVSILKELHGKAYEIDVRYPNRLLTDYEAKELAVVLNTHEGEFDFEVLDIEFAELDLNEYNILLPAFDDDNEPPFADEKEVIKLEAKEDDYEAPETIKTDIVLGDLFEIGNHRLLCGDSTDSDAVAKLMNGKKAELLFTSPPYSNMRTYEGGKDLSIDKLVDFIPTFMPFTNYQVVNLGLQKKDYEIVEYWNAYIAKARQCGLKLLSWNVWDKTSAGSVAHATHMFWLTHEWLFVFGKKPKDLNRTIPNQIEKYEAKHGKDFLNGVIVSNRQQNGEMVLGKSKAYTHHQLHTVIQQTPELGSARYLHPATFPVKLPAAYIEAMTNENEIVCEPFTGSGSTMVASHQLNRRCYGMELEPKYCEVIIQRMLKLDKTLTITRNGKDVTNDYLKKIQ